MLLRWEGGEKGPCASVHGPETLVCCGAELIGAFCPVSPRNPTGERKGTELKKQVDGQQKR